MASKQLWPFLEVLSCYFLTSGPTDADGAKVLARVVERLLATVERERRDDVATVVSVTGVHPAGAGSDDNPTPRPCGVTDRDLCCAHGFARGGDPDADQRTHKDNGSSQCCAS